MESFTFKLIVVFILFMFLISNLVILIGVSYEWDWVFRLRPPYLPDKIGWKKARQSYLINTLVGMFMVLIFLLNVLFPSTDEVVLIVVALFLSLTTVVVIFNSRKNQSIRDLFVEGDVE